MRITPFSKYTSMLLFIILDDMSVPKTDSFYKINL